VFGSITLAHFERFFQSISLQDGAAFALLRRDGMLLARYPRSDQIGKIVPLAETRAKLGSAHYVQSQVDGQLRIVSARPLANYPLVLAVSQTEESALRSWRILAHQSTSMAYLRTLFVLLMAWAACRWWQRQRSLTEQLRIQNLRFDTALDNMGTGLCMFDAEKRLVVCNKRYAELYQLPPELLKPGTPHRAIITHRVRYGILRGENNEGAVQQKLSALHKLPADATSTHARRRLGRDA
jgi:PAS domain-containing protein